MLKFVTKLSVGCSLLLSVNGLANISCHTLALGGKTFRAHLSADMPEALNANSYADVLFTATDALVAEKALERSLGQKLSLAGAYLIQTMSANGDLNKMSDMVQLALFDKPNDGCIVIFLNDPQGTLQYAQSELITEVSPERITLGKDKIFLTHLAGSAMPSLPLGTVHDASSL